MTGGTVALRAAGLLAFIETGLHWRFVPQQDRSALMQCGWQRVYAPHFMALDPSSLQTQSGNLELSSAPSRSLSLA